METHNNDYYSIAFDMLVNRERDSVYVKNELVSKGMSESDAISLINSIIRRSRKTNKSEGTKKLITGIIILACCGLAFAIKPKLGIYTFIAGISYIVYSIFDFQKS